jgi:hypothetical protein
VSDSIWLDSLVRLRRLTHFQAREIEAERGHALLIAGRYLLLKPRHSDPILPAYEALDRQLRRRVLVIQGSLPAADEAAANRLGKTTRNLAACRGVVPSVPMDFHVEGQRHILINPLPDGESLDKLVVRRGRFPESIVRGIGRELSFQLAQTESLACHGDLRLSNFWLCGDGSAVVTNWGLLNSLVPAISIHVPVPLDMLDGIAPERLSEARPAGTTSDLYAFGCTLWQLLAGRPPFLVADPLGKMMSQRTLSIPEIRSVAPDVSETFSKLLARLTEKDPQRRPASFEEVHALLAPARRGRSRLKAFSRSFASASPLSDRFALPSRARLPRLAAAMFLSLAIIGLAWYRDPLGLPGLLRVSANVAHGKSSATGMGTTPPLEEPSRHPPTIEHAQEDSPRIATFPAPDADGVIFLNGDQDYSGATLRGGRQLTLQGSPEQPAIIRIRETPLVLEAEIVRLVHARIIIESSQSPDQIPVRIQAGEISIENCRIEQWAEGSSGGLIAWEFSELESARSGRLHMRDCVLLSDRAVFDIRSPVTTVFFENVYREGSGPLLRMQSGARAGLQVPVMVNACTFRKSGPLIRFTGDRFADSGRLSLQGAESVIDLDGGAAVIELMAESLRTDWQQHLEIAAQGLVVRPAAVLVGVALPGPKHAFANVQEVDTGSMRIDGVLSGEFHFEPGNALSGLQRVVIDSLPVRYSPRPPGADVTRLPAAIDRPGGARPSL